MLVTGLSILRHEVKIRKNSGFSLIELIIVMAIMGIVAAIAAPNFTRYRDNTNLREAARDVMSDIQLYKQRAMAENQNYLITFTGNTYDVKRGATLVVDDKPIGAGNAAIVIKSHKYPAGLQLFSRGSTEPSVPSGDGLVLKHNGRGSEAKISISTMGKVSVTYDPK